MAVRRSMIVRCCLHHSAGGLRSPDPWAQYRTSCEAENSRQARHQFVSCLKNSGHKGTEEPPAA